MNKKSIIGIAAAITLMLPLGVFAATSESTPAKAVRQFCHFDMSKLTDVQKTDLQGQMVKMLELKKETTQKMIDNGSIPKEQGDTALKALDEKIAKVKSGDLEFGKGMKGSEQKFREEGGKRGHRGPGKAFDGNKSKGQPNTTTK